MSGDVTLGIALDEKIEVSWLMVARDWCVRTNDLFALDIAALRVGHIESCAERDMLADGQAEDAVFGGKLESVNGGVVRDLGLLGDGEFLEIVGVKHFLVTWCCWLCCWRKSAEGYSTE